MPAAAGRENWAILASLINSAKLHGHDSQTLPRGYLGNGSFPAKQK
jgi:hypothetical protein